jgi:hypothetical protein
MSPIIRPIDWFDPLLACVRVSVYKLFYGTLRKFPYKQKQSRHLCRGLDYCAEHYSMVQAVFNIEETLFFFPTAFRMPVKSEKGNIAHAF